MSQAHFDALRFLNTLISNAMSDSPMKWDKNCAMQIAAYPWLAKTIEELRKNNNTFALWHQCNIQLRKERLVELVTKGLRMNPSRHKDLPFFLAVLALYEGDASMAETAIRELGKGGPISSGQQFDKGCIILLQVPTSPVDIVKKYSRTHPRELLQLFK